MFKQILAVVAISLVVVSEGTAQQAGQPAPNAGPNIAIVRRHAGLKFATMQPLSSATSLAGEDVQLRLVDPLIINDATVLPAGEVVHAKVIKVKKADKHCHDGEVKLELDRITFADSSTVKVKVWSVSPSPKVEVATRLYHQYGLMESDLEINNWWEAVLAAPMLVFEFAMLSPILVFLPLALFSSCNTPGKDLVLPENSTVVVEVRQDHKVRY